MNGTLALDCCISSPNIYSTAQTVPLLEVSEYLDLGHPTIFTRCRLVPSMHHSSTYFVKIQTSLIEDTASVEDNATGMLIL